MLLFRHLCKLKPPPSSNSWSAVPDSSDKSLEADIVRLNIYQYTIFAHAVTCSISGENFKQLSEQICEIFERRGGSSWKWIAKTMLDEELTECETTAYLNRLKEWYILDAGMKEIFQDCDRKFDIKMDRILQNKLKMKEEVEIIAGCLKLQPLPGKSAQVFFCRKLSFQIEFLFKHTSLSKEYLLIQLRSLQPLF